MNLKLTSEYTHPHSVPAVGPESVWPSRDDRLLLGTGEDGTSWPLGIRYSHVPSLAKEMGTLYRSLHSSLPSYATGFGGLMSGGNPHSAWIPERR